MAKAVARGLPVQLPHCVVPQVSISNPGRSRSEVRRRTYQGSLRMEGRSDRRTECDERSRASGGNRSAESLAIRVDGSSEGQDSHRIVQNLQEPEAETILGESFLEPRLLRNDYRSGRGEDTTVRATSGRQGAARGKRARRTRPLLEATQVHRLWRWILVCWACSTALG